MGNESSSKKCGKHSLHADELKTDFPLLTRTFVEHASKSVGNKKFLIENDATNSLFAKIPEFGSIFFKKYRNEQENEMDLVSFLKIGNQFSSQSLNSSAENILKFYATMFSSDEENLTKDEITSLMRVSMLSSLVISKLEISINFDQIANAFIRTIFKRGDEDKNIIEINKFVSFTNENPFCLRDLQDHIVYRLLKRTNKKMNQASNKVDEATNDSSDLYKTCCDNQSIVGISGLWIISSLVPHSFIPSSEFGTVSNFSKTLEKNGWHILYDSNKQGLSANGFSHKVLGYPGSTLTFLKFGGFLILLGLDVEWRESHAKRGGYDCFLYQLLPELKVVQRNSDSCVHFNLTSRTIKKGIVFGKENKIFLELNSDFSNVLYDSTTYALSRLEVWGCGGIENYERYVGQKTWEKKDTSKHQNRKLRPEDWKDNPDRILLDYGGIETEHSKRGDM